MVRKKKDETERTCATCGRGPDKDKCMDGEDCENGDLWFPTPPECDGDSCKISVNGGPAVPFPSKEATEQVTEMVKEHLVPHGSVVSERPFGNGHVLTEYADGWVSLDGSQPVTKEIMKGTLDFVESIKGDKKPTQLDLSGKPAEYPVGVEEESYTVLTFECGSWTLKVREDRLQRAAEDDNVLGLVQRRLKAGSELYPLSEGEFDRWVQRFTRSLTNYVRTGCA